MGASDYSTTATAAAAFVNILCASAPLYLCVKTILTTLCLSYLKMMEKPGGSGGRQNSKQPISAPFP